MVIIIFASCHRRQDEPYLHSARRTRSFQTGEITPFLNTQLCHTFRSRFIYPRQGSFGRTTRCGCRILESLARIGSSLTAVRTTRPERMSRSFQRKRLLCTEPTTQIQSQGATRGRSSKIGLQMTPGLTWMSTISGVFGRARVSMFEVSSPIIILEWLATKSLSLTRKWELNMTTNHLRVYKLGEFANRRSDFTPSTVLTTRHQVGKRNGPSTLHGELSTIPAWIMDSAFSTLSTVVI